MRVRESGGARKRIAALLRFARDVILLMRDLATDRRVPTTEKWGPVAFAVAYMAVPVNAIPDDLPVVGHLDDAAVLMWAARRYLRAAGYHVAYDHWRGTDEGLAMVLTLAGVER